MFLYKNVQTHFWSLYNLHVLILIVYIGFTQYFKYAFIIYIYIYIYIYLYTQLRLYFDFNILLSYIDFELKNQIIICKKIFLLCF